MQVLALREGPDEPLVVREVSHDPHLDLAVVGGEKRRVAIAHDEALADAPPRLGADGDVLQVGLGARQATRSRDGLLEGRVDPPVAFGQRDESVDGLPQPAPVAPAQDALENGVLGLGEEGLQRLRIRGVARLDLLRLGQSPLPEQDLLQLLG